MKMAWRAALLVALLGVAGASAGPLGTVTKCSWSQGVCSASPGYVMDAIAPVKAPSPMAQGILRTLALDAACQVYKTPDSCEAHEHDKGCDWSLKGLTAEEPEEPSCTVLPDWAEAKSTKLGTMHGCPGTIGYALHACAAAESRDACAAVDAECAWVEESEAHAALADAGATSEQFPQAVGPRRRLMFADEEAPEAADGKVSVAAVDAGGDEAPALVQKVGRDTLLAPDGDALVGCVPAQMKRLVEQRDIKGLDTLNTQLEHGSDGTYGHCDNPAIAMLEQCAALNKHDACVAAKQCQWDTEYSECALKQGHMLEKLLGADSPAVQRSMDCHARATKEECLGAGEITYAPEALGKGLVDGPELPVMAVVPAGYDPNIPVAVPKQAVGGQQQDL